MVYNFREKRTTSNDQYDLFKVSHLFILTEHSRHSLMKHTHIICTLHSRWTDHTHMCNIFQQTNRPLISYCTENCMNQNRLRIAINRCKHLKDKYVRPSEMCEATENFISQLKLIKKVLCGHHFVNRHHINLFKLISGSAIISV